MRLHDWCVNDHFIISPSAFQPVTIVAKNLAEIDCAVCIPSCFALSMSNRIDQNFLSMKPGYWKKDYPACARGDGKVPGGSGVHATNKMVVDLTEGNSSEDTRKRTEKKSALSKFFSWCNRGPNLQRSARKLRVVRVNWISLCSILFYLLV